MADYQREVGSRIAELRERAGLTQEDLAQALRELGLSATARTVQRWEAGVSRPRRKALEGLAQFFEVGLQEITGAAHPLEDPVVLAELAELRDALERVESKLDRLLDGRAVDELRQALVAGGPEPRVMSSPSGRTADPTRSRPR